MLQYNIQVHFDLEFMSDLYICFIFCIFNYLLIRIFRRQCLPCILGENTPTPNPDVPSSMDPEERATSARSGGLANFHSDGDKSRHPCKESPEDAQAAFASGYTRYSRWRSPQKSIICNVLYLERQDMLSHLPIYRLHISITTSVAITHLSYAALSLAELLKTWPGIISRKIKEKSKK